MVVICENIGRFDETCIYVYKSTYILLLSAFAMYQTIMHGMLRRQMRYQNEETFFGLDATHLEVVALASNMLIYFPANPVNHRSVILYLHNLTTTYQIGI